MAVGSLAALSAGALSSLTRMSPWLLGVASVLHVAKMTAEARAWHGIVGPSHAGAPIPFRTTLGAFLGAIGANALLPARVGEAFRLGIVRRYANGASLAAMGGTVVLETLLELGFATLGDRHGARRWPLGRHARQPGRHGRHASGVPAAVGALLVAAALLCAVLRRRIAPVIRELARGFAVLRHPHALGRVIGWKVVAWALRIGMVATFLLAFGLPATFWTVALVLAAQNAAALLPLTPGKRRDAAGGARRRARRNRERVLGARLRHRDAGGDARRRPRARGRCRIDAGRTTGDERGARSATPSHARPELMAASCVGDRGDTAVSMISASILVLEDDGELRSLLVRGLEEEGFRVSTSSSAADLLAGLESRGPADALVVDIGLPDADGRDVVQALRARGVSTPVLFLTARDALPDRLAGFAAGGDDYLTKPFALRRARGTAAGPRPPRARRDASRPGAACSSTPARTR